MSTIVFNNSRTHQNIEIIDNGNDRPDAADRVLINGHSYRLDRISLLGPRDQDRLAFQALQSTLRVSDFRHITSLSAAADVYRNRLEANTAASDVDSFVQFGTPAERRSLCADANRLHATANELADRFGMGRSELLDCASLSASTRLYVGGSATVTSNGSIVFPLFTLQGSFGSRPTSPSPQE